MIAIIHNPWAVDAERRMKNAESIRDMIQEQAAIIVPIINCVPDPQKSAAWNINRSHRKIVQHAQDWNRRYTIIIEDDNKFAGDPVLSFLKFYNDVHTIATSGAKVDMYFACTYGDIGDNPKHLVKITEPVGMHCYAVFDRFYDTFLSVDQDEHIDKALSGLGHYRVIYPFVAIQEPGWSSNQKMNTDFNNELFMQHVVK
jgi:hypothetical protein